MKKKPNKKSPKPSEKMEEVKEHASNALIRKRSNIAVKGSCK